MPNSKTIKDKDRLIFLDHLNHHSSFGPGWWCKYIKPSLLRKVGRQRKAYYREASLIASLHPYRNKDWSQVGGTE